ncbi:hypothetical protein BBK14_09535 [Parafrankia soli]|uniref:HTH cro/C1-type domain-containing protein n=2 Tax=Parafrankia soli TaxID=2599596 RepID=A0A1S1RFX1_9ACTN|nr:hypothetical protein BBK14_09535 [Parafrankia soli]
MVIGEVRRHRQAQDMSAAELSDACARLGLPVHRSVIANLEGGRRGSVTIAELIAFAAALDVAPAQLLCPVGYADEVEMPPGRIRPTWDAFEWITGACPEQTETPVAHYRKYYLYLREEREAQQRADEQEHRAGHLPAGPLQDAVRATATAERGRAQAIRTALDVLRKDMISAGFLPPADLPDEAGTPA